MKQTKELLEIGEYDVITDLIPEGTKTLKEVLADYKLLSVGYHTILVNGKKADEDTLITPQSELVIVPMIAGG